MTAAKLDSNQRAALLTVGRLMQRWGVGDIELYANTFTVAMEPPGSGAGIGCDLLDAFERAIGDECSLDGVGLLMGGKDKGERWPDTKRLHLRLNCPTLRITDAERDALRVADEVLQRLGIDVVMRGKRDVIVTTRGYPERRAQERGLLEAVEGVVG